MIKDFSVNSLRRRILRSSFGTILFFLLLAGVALDKAFQRVLRSNISDQLENLTFSLLATAEINAKGQLTIPRKLPQSAISIPESGLIALIVDENDDVVWRSPSSLGENLPLLSAMAPGKSDFTRNKRNPREPFIYRFGSVWGSGDENDRHLTFVTMQYKSVYLSQIKNYRETIVQWLGGGSLLILLIHGIVILRELRPLRIVVNEIDAIEQGISDHIKGEFPTELAMMTERINRFIRNEREQLVRYRHGLDDLAHSLKTPLAVIQSLGQNEANSKENKQLNEQIDRMTEIIDYQLKRAASAGKDTLGAHQTELCPVILRTIASLDKVYAAKEIEHNITCDEKLMFPGDKDDAYEIIGNISDNAYKWANSQIKINCSIREAQDERWLRIAVHDDGPGFSEDSQQKITERGVRADEQMPGQGIGLAVVQSIVRNYNGTLNTGKSQLGGGLVSLRFPLET